jgi:hypothetical protein
VAGIVLRNNRRWAFKKGSPVADLKVDANIEIVDGAAAAGEL